ncbi:MAG: ATP-binding protein [Myxococcota bacterium]|nr:ATP-binding protein [Myxococcota bacterium]
MILFGQLSILRRLLLAYFLLIVVVGAVTSVASLRIWNSTTQMVLTGDGLLPLANALGELKALSAATSSYLEARPNATQEDEIARYSGALKTRAKHLEKHREKLLTKWSDQGFIPAITDSLGELVQTLEGLSSEPEETNLSSDLRQIDEQTQRTLVLTRARLTQFTRRAEQIRSGELRLLIGLAIAGVLAVILLSVAMIAPLRRLQLLRQAVHDLERGRPVPELAGGQDEIGRVLQAFNRMVEAIRKREGVLGDERSQARALQREADNLVESIPLAIVLADGSGRVRRINRAARNLLGTRPQDLVGKSLNAPPIGPLLPGGETRLQSILSGDEQWVMEEVSHGAKQTLTVHLIPLEDRGERVLTSQIKGAILVIEDVSRRVQAEEGLRRHERHAAMGRVAARVVHEVRNPLSTIGLAARMLSDDLPKNSDPEGWLAQIRSEAERLERVTDAYLRLARLPDPQPNPIILAPFVKEVAAFLNDPRISVEIDHELRVMADIDGLKGVLMNLIQNAQQALGEEGGSIQVQAKGEGDRTVLTITDNGPGLPNNVLQQLGEPFVDGRPSGTGLGIALAMEILSNQDGHLAIENGEQGGACCLINLPQA